MATSTPKPAHFFVNNLTGVCELRVVGGLRTLEKKVRAILAALPEGSFTAPPKALWRHYIDCNVRGGTDAYELRFQVRNAAAVEKALFALQYGK